jgi:hypothetical protein
MNKDVKKLVKKFWLAPCTERNKLIVEKQQKDSASHAFIIIDIFNCTPIWDYRSTGFLHDHMENVKKTKSRLVSIIRLLSIDACSVQRKSTINKLFRYIFLSLAASTA